MRGLDVPPTERFGGSNEDATLRAPSAARQPTTTRSRPHCRNSRASTTKAHSSTADSMFSPASQMKLQAFFKTPNTSVSSPLPCAGNSKSTPVGVSEKTTTPAPLKAPEAKTPSALGKKSAHTGKKKAHRNSKRDSTKPKRPKNGYMLFVAAKQSSLRATQPDLSWKESLSVLAQQWKEADEATKAPFLQEAAQLMKDYQKHLRAWKDATTKHEKENHGSVKVVASQANDAFDAADRNELTMAKERSPEEASQNAEEIRVESKPNGSSDQADRGLTNNTSESKESEPEAPQTPVSSSSTQPESLVGSKVLKTFGDEGDFKGVIQQVTQRDPCFLRVVYEDGDVEDVPLDEAMEIAKRFHALRESNHAEEEQATSAESPLATPGIPPLDTGVKDSEEDLPKPMHADRKLNATDAPLPRKTKRKNPEDEPFVVVKEDAEEDADEDSVNEIEFLDNDEDIELVRKVKETEEKLRMALTRGTRQDELDFHRGVEKATQSFLSEVIVSGELSSSFDMMLARLIQGAREPRDLLAETVQAHLTLHATEDVNIKQIASIGVIRDRMALIAERKAYGQKSRNASEWNDTSDQALWCWEVEKASTKLLAVSDKDLRTIRRMRTETGKLVKLLSQLLKELEKGDVDSKKVTTIEESIAKHQRKEHQGQSVHIKKKASKPSSSSLLSFFGKPSTTTTKAENRKESRSPNANGVSVVDLCREDSVEICTPVEGRRKCSTPGVKAKFAPREMRNPLQGTQPMDYISQMRASDKSIEELRFPKTCETAKNADSKHTAFRRLRKRRQKKAVDVKIRKKLRTIQHNQGVEVDYSAAVISWEFRVGEKDPQTDELRICKEPEEPDQDVAKPEIVDVDDTTSKDALLDPTPPDSNSENKVQRVYLDGRMRFLQFHEDERPAYYGTISRMLGERVGPKNPLGKDTKILNYEYDSGEDWEDEGEGESLSDTDGEEENDGNDLDYDDGWLRYDDDLGSDVDLEDAESSDDEVTSAEEPLDFKTVTIGEEAKSKFDPRAPKTKNRVKRPATVAERLAKASNRQLQKGFVAGPFFGLSPVKITSAQRQGDEGLALLGKYPVTVSYEAPASCISSASLPSSAKEADVEKPVSDNSQKSTVAAIFQPKCWCPDPVPLERIWENRKLDAGKRAEDDGSLDVEDLCAGRTLKLMADEDAAALAKFAHRRISKSSALIDDFLLSYPEIKSTRKTIKEVLLQIAQKCPHTDEWEVRKKLRKRFGLPTAQEEEYAEMQEEWRSKKGTLSGRRAASKEEEDAKQFPKDAIYFANTGSSYLSFTDAWKALRKSGWSWRNGKGLTSYVYVRTKGKAPSRGGVQNDDFFISEEDAAAYLRDLDDPTIQRDLPFLWEWKTQHTSCEMDDSLEHDGHDEEGSFAEEKASQLFDVPSFCSNDKHDLAHEIEDAYGASPKVLTNRTKRDKWRTEDGGWIEHKESDLDGSVL